jgi:hypothetical protein
VYIGVLFVLFVFVLVRRRSLAGLIFRWASLGRLDVRYAQAVRTLSQLVAERVDTAARGRHGRRLARIYQLGPQVAGELVQWAPFGAQRRTV